MSHIAVLESKVHAMPAFVQQFQFYLVFALGLFHKCCNLTISEKEQIQFGAEPASVV